MNIQYPITCKIRAGLRNKRKSFSFWLLLIVLTALLLRLLVVLELYQIRAVVNPLEATDMSTYLDLASDILEGRFPDRFYYQPFYYSVFLPLIFAIFGYSTTMLAIVQAAVGALTVWLTGWSTRFMFGRRAGIIAALFLALARFHIFYTPFALIAVLQGLWLAAIVACFLWALRRGGWQRWAVLGLIFGCANLTRGNIILLLPGVLICLIVIFRHQRRALVINGAVFLVMMAAVQAPFALYNMRAVGHWTGPSTAADAVLALGNNPEAPPGGLIYTATYETWMSMAGEVENETTVPRLIAEWVRREPLAWLELKGRAFLLFWAPEEIPNNVNFEVHGADSRVLQLPFLLGFWALGGFGLAGIVLSLRSRRRRRSLPILFAVYCVAAYCGATVVFYILARFRLPVVPLLCIFAGYALHYLLGELRVCRFRGFTPKQRRHFGVTLLLLLLPMLFVLEGFDFYRHRLEAPVMRVARPNGVMALDGDSVVVYDHGPEYLGGWEPQALSAPESRAEISKVFKLLRRPEIEQREPIRLRIPFIFISFGDMKIEVRKNYKTVGKLETEIAPSKSLQWEEVELSIDDRDYAGRRLELEAAITVESPSEAFIMIDRQRNYGRTRLTVNGLSLDSLPSDYEVCMQLVFE